MKTNKKFYGIILSLAMMLSAISPAMAAVVNYGEELTNMPDKYYEQSFDDVPKSHWAFECIEEMVDRKVLAGFPDGKFYPNNNVTRAQFAKIMVSAAGMPLTINLQSSYTDVETTEWYSPYIESARYYLSGYINNGKSYYYPNSNALREDIAVALVKLKGYDTTGYDLSILQTMFTDWKSISEGARPYVAVAVENELISGYDDGTFRGQQGVTRAEASALLWRAYQYGNNNKDFEQNTSNLEKEDLTPKPTTTPTPEPTKEPEKEVVKPTEVPEPTEEPEETETPEPEKTPEPKTYGWKVSTIKNGIDNAMNIQAVPDGVIFSDGNKVFKLNDNGKLTTLFDADEYPYQGTEELSKRTKISNNLETISYNRNDGNVYALIEQSPSSGYSEFLYNITLDETQASIDTGDLQGCYNRPNITLNLHFYENGDFLVGGYANAERYSSDGDHIEKLYGAYESIMILNNKLYSCYCDNQGISGVDCDNPMWSEVYKFGGTYSMPGYDKFYGNSKGEEITTLDINGDAGFLLSFDDIENEEARTFSLEQVIQYGAISDDESRLYFYDNAYGSIRLIQRNK